MMPLYEGNANDVVQTLRRADTGAAITDAVLVGWVYDPHGATLQTLTFSHFGEGEYRATTTSSITVGVEYKIDIKSTNYLFRRIVFETGKESLGSK